MAMENHNRISGEDCTTGGNVQENGSLSKRRKENNSSKPLVEFAPLIVPLERRLQTLAALSMISMFFVIVPFGSIFLAYIYFYTDLWYFSLMYVAWIFLDRKTCITGGRIVVKLREWKIWHYYRDYFPIKLVKTAELDPSKNYLLASHPHGVLSCGSFGCFATEALGIGKLFQGMTVHFLTLRLNFMLPFFRELVLNFGGCCVSKESMNYLLSYPGGGKMVVTVPGGAVESLDAHPGTYVLRIKNRKGFIKLALQNGVSLVPVISFGENDLYEQISFSEGSTLRNIQDRLRKMLSFTPLLLKGRGIFQYSFGLIPRRRPIVTVVGAPLQAKHIYNPTQVEIDELHGEYIQALTKLFYDNRDQYDSSGAELKII